MMKKLIRKLGKTITVGLMLVFVACGVSCSLNPLSLQGSQPQASATPLLPEFAAADVPDARPVVVDYLEAWKAEDYVKMYALLTSVSQAGRSEIEFSRHYQSVAVEAALQGITYEVMSLLVNPESAQARYRVTLHSILVGDITRETLMNLSLEANRWRVQWDDTLILPELDGGNYLLMDRSGYTPARANIYDRNGLALVAQADAVALGVYSNQVDLAQKDDLFAQLSELTGKSIEAIQAIYTSVPEGRRLVFADGRNLCRPFGCPI